MHSNSTSEQKQTTADEQASERTSPNPRPKTSNPKVTKNIHRDKLRKRKRIKLNGEKLPFLLELYI